MASSPTKDAPHQTTRQLLDELDALMERMLALPIEDQETDTPHPTLQPPHAPTVAATLTLVEAPTELRELAEQPAPAPPIEMEMAPRVVAPEPVADEPASQPEPDEFHYVTTLPDRPALSLHDVAAPATEELTPLPPKFRVRPSMGYQFLLWVNRGYDRSTGWFGRSGRLLRSGLFRMLLGLVGLGLIVTAVGWLAWDWLDWKQ